MDPSRVFCSTETCPDKGRVGAGNIRIHSQKQRRYRCATCGDTFSATTGTPYYRLHKEAWLMTAALSCSHMAARRKLSWPRSDSTSAR